MMGTGIKNYYQTMNRIYDHLQDEESKSLFELRINFLLNQSQDDYTEGLCNLYHDWHPSGELDEKMAELMPKEIIIFTCGFGGMHIKKMLPYQGYKASCFCDNFRAGETVDGLRVLSVDEMIKEHGNGLVILGSHLHAREIYKQLLDRGMDKKYILSDTMLVWSRGDQYRDVFEPLADEVYVDAGAFDGSDVQAFSRWTNGNYKKIFAFEPVSSMCDVIRQNVREKNIPNVEICNYAVWNRKETLKFSESGAGSSVTEAGEYEVSGTDIDSVVKDEKVTFIKMDVEGSELKALEGAKQTILNNRPRLAICIYHKPEDIIEIPFYILSLVPEYKFYIRHYASNMWETVLYAEV